MDIRIILVLIGVNIIAFLMYGADKYRATRKKWRIPEKVLIGIALCGGSAGALLGMYVFHHKTRKNKFRIGIPLIFVAQIIVVVSACRRIY
jgi:uncharacterized membrane protein YsdA (DUF1294 family)